MGLKVHCRQLERYQVQVSGAGHSWLADEPPALGGDGRAPNPFAHLLGALGSCTIITLAAYAAKARLPVAGLQAEVEGEWGEGEGRGEFRVALLVRVRGEVGEEGLARLARAAQKCPVYRVLAPGAKIEHRLEPAGKGE